MSQNKLTEWAKKHKILSVIIIIFAIIIIGNALGGENKSTPNTANTNNDQQETVQTEQPKEKVWTSVFKITANSEKQTKAFNLQGGQQKIIYKTTGGDYSLCMVYVMKEGTTLESNGGIPAVSIDGNKSDETMLRKGKGQYYLDIRLNGPNFKLWSKSS
ncbi:MAG: hypothetical protein PHG95_02815 [Patescibacteria group bacterium]|nr:hypothetical protein [Patescibacteria group bacterium]